MEMSASKKMPAVYFVLLNWKGCQDTLDCLESMTRLSYLNYCAVVVDNASGDGSSSALKSWAQKKGIPVSEYEYGPAGEGLRAISRRQAGTSGFRQLLLIASLSNTGFCAGNNIGMSFARESGAEYLFVLNNDTLLAEGVLEPLVRTAQSRSDAALFSPLILYADKKETIWWGGGDFNHWMTPSYRHKGKDASSLACSGPYESQWASGCATFMQASIFDKFGGFDESFFIWCEEWDLSMRIRSGGYRIMVVPSSCVYHKIGRSLGITSPLVFYYSFRNLLMFRERYLPFYKVLAYLVPYLPFKLLKALFYTVKFRQAGFLLGYFDAVLAGLRRKGGGWARQ